MANYPGYQTPQFYYNPYTPPQPQTPQNAQNFANAASNPIIWVQGEAGAKSYLVAPNNTAQLWDSEAQVIYLKSADACGIPSIKILDYTIRDASNAPEAPAPVYATADELAALRKQVEALKKQYKTNSKEAE